ncbi:MAG: WD40 repeat domain-containing serine/threonine-protein kinase [Verrucomicrobiota bacterium]
MNADRAKVLELVSAALELTDLEERDRFLRSACNAQPGLYEKVLAVLGAVYQPVDDSDSATVQLTNSDETILATIRNAERPGTVIGRYKLLEQLGEGGMGTVWMAEQFEPVQRKVALKVIRHGMDSQNVLARFEAERQALALMDHANIAKVLDAGATPSGRPYFVMELVKGIPITAYCDEKRLTIRERLDLFIAVCQAIQHAHQKGIIHRDIKPSNVLVAIYDDKPVAKVIDFGIAKATGQKLTDRTFFTEIGALIGTPEYMSPEQAELNQLDIDTRSDIYSLGVLLYELLTGTTPITREAFRRAAFDEMLRRIREEEPVKPSHRLTQHENLLSSIARQRKVQAAQLRTLVKGDLDSIVMKSLEKNRAQRYETANGLAMDIQRHLRNEPIVARAATSWERTVKWIKRRPAMAALVLVVIAASVACGALAAYASKQAILANHKAYEAEVNARKEATEKTRAERALDETRRVSYEANIYAAAAALDRRETAVALRLLKACDPKLRNWEWSHLGLVADGSLLTIDHSEPGWSRVCGLSPDGKWMADITGESLSMWSCETGQLKWQTNGIRSANCIAFTDDSRVFAVGINALSPERQDTPLQVQLWQVERCQQVDTVIFSESGGITSLAFDRSGERLLVASTKSILGNNARIHLMERGSHKEPLLLGQDDSRVEFLAVLPDNKSAVSSSRSANRLWSFTDGSARPISLGEPYAINQQFAVASGSAQVFQLMAEGNRFSLVDAASRRVLHPFAPQVFFRWAVGPSANRLVASWNNTFDVWDLSGTNLLGTFQHPSVILYLGLTPDGLKAVTTDYFRIKVWDLRRGGAIQKLEQGNPLAVPNTMHQKEAQAFAEAALKGQQYQKHMIQLLFLDRTRLLGVDSLGEVFVWDTLSGQLIQNVVTAGVEIADMAVSAGGKRLALAREQVVEVWDLEQRRLVKMLERPVSEHRFEEYRGCIAFSPDATEFLAICRDGIRLWNSSSWTSRLFVKKEIRSATFAPDGKTVAIGSRPNKLEVLDVRSMRLLRAGEKNEDLTYLTSLIFDPSGRQLAGVVTDQILLWDAMTLQRTGALRMETAGYSHLTFSPDGTRLAVAPPDATVRIWDPSHQSMLLTLRGHKDLVSSLAFSDDGTELASGGADGSVYLWRTTGGSGPETTRLR